MPGRVWTGPGQPSQFWQVAYHTLFFTHLYLQPDEKAFQPWQHHREEYQFFDEVPWPPHLRASYAALQVGLGCYAHPP